MVKELKKVDSSEKHCFLSKKEFLFLVRCLNEDYVELKNKMWEIEDLYNHLKHEAEARWYYDSELCCLSLAASRKEIELPF
jgi:hypothetical protein